MEQQKNKTKIPRHYTEERINLVALINAQMCTTAHEISADPLTEADRDWISCMAEDIAFQLPEDTTFGDLNGLDADMIIDYVRSMRDKAKQLNRQEPVFYRRWWHGFSRWARTIDDPTLAIFITFGCLIISILIIMWGLL